MSARWAAIALALLLPAPALAAELPLPPAWHFTRTDPQDDYVAGLTDLGSHGGKTCGYVKSGLRTPKGWGDVNQVFKADKYRGKRLRLTGWLKPVDVHGFGIMWMRVEGKGGKVLALDDGFGRKIAGSGGWRKVAVVLDVPAHAEAITFGVGLNGAGALCFDDLTFDVVGKAVPTTDQRRAMGPANLDLEH